MEFLFNEVEFYGVMYLPLYRQEQELRRMGVQLSRQTMSKWLTLACEKYLKPIYERLKKRVQAADICHADEAPRQVLNEASLNSMPVSSCTNSGRKQYSSALRKNSEVVTNDNPYDI